MDGVISAALYHAKARQIGAGIYTSFGSRNETSTGLKTLHAYIRLGISEKANLSETRIVMLVGHSTTILQEMQFEDVSTYNNRVIRLDKPHYKPHIILRPLFRLGTRCLVKHLGKEEAVYTLANWLFHIT